jgi:hypothetical protein
MKRPDKWIWENTDSITKWLQVLALVFAAIWTYVVFRDTEAPSLETPVAVGAALDGKLIDQSTCELVASFDINNPGLRTVAVDKIRVRLWTWPIKADRMNGKLYYLDLDRPPATTLFDQMPTTALIAKYAPKTHLYAFFAFHYAGGSPAESYFLARADALDSKQKLIGYAYALKRNICSGG